METKDSSVESVFSKGFNTLEKQGGRYYVKMQFQNQDDAYAAYREIQGLTPDQQGQQSTGYTAVDMTTAAAQGFRDGVGSVVVKLPQRLKQDGRAVVIDKDGEFLEYCDVVGAIIAAGGSVKE